MQPALVENQWTPSGSIATADGALTKRIATKVAAIYSILAVVVFVVAPELRMFAPMWFLWALVMTGAAAAYAGGSTMQRRARQV